MSAPCRRPLVGRRVGWEAGAVIVDSVSSFPLSNRACGSPTHGFPTSFTVRHVQSGGSELFRRVGVCQEIGPRSR